MAPQPVKAGTVAIADEQAGIYPMMVGVVATRVLCPDVTRQLAAGDEIQFVAS